MQSLLRIKPYPISMSQGFDFANAIFWAVMGIDRDGEQAELQGSLLNIYTREIPDENGVLQTIEFVSPVLENFQIMVPKEILDIWGPDSVIDDFIISVSNFERE